MESSRRRHLVSRSLLADVFDVNRRRITIWASEGMPVAQRQGKGRENLYDLAAVVQWRVDTLVRSGGGNQEAGAGSVNLGVERARLARAQTAKALMDLGLRQRELLPKAEIEQVFGGCIHAIRAAILALPRSMAERVVAAVQTLPGVAEALEPKRLQAVGLVEAELKGQAHDALRALAQLPVETFGAAVTSGGGLS